MAAPVDLRSDTITRPTPEMLRAMAEAPLGDDVLGDDPSVQRLEEMAASLLGKEAALFVPSGSMGNNIAIKVHTRPGDEVLMDADAHSMLYECGAPAVISGVQTRQFRSVRGIPNVDEVLGAVSPEDFHGPGTTLVIVENTHNRHGGIPVPVGVVRELASGLRERGVALHMDGARIFNTTVATGTPAADFAAETDSISFCLSKGLGCPVGSMLCGTREFIGRARRVRQMLGGGMRQAGVLAACGIVALDTMIDRLANDHANARRLAEGIADVSGIALDLSLVQSNMVYFDTTRSAPEVQDELDTRGVRCFAVGPKTIRFVTHKDVDEAGVDRAAAICREMRF